MLGLLGLVGLVAAWAVVYAVAARLYRQGRLRRDIHRDVAAAGVIALAVVGFFWRLLLTESWIPKGGGDLSSFIYPTYVFAARWIRRGVIPLWNPHLYMGMPFAADNQSGLFYPLNLLFFALDPELSYETVELMVVMHIYIAGLLAYVLVRDLSVGSSIGENGTRRVGRTAAVGGAIAYMFSDVFVIHLGNLNIIATAAWLPLVLFCFRRALSGRSWGWVRWTGVVLGVSALVGHAQMFLYICLSLGLYACWVAYERRRDGLQVAAATMGKLAVVGIIAVGLAAVAILPAYDLTQYTVRAVLTYEQASDLGMLPAGLIGVLMPGFWGRATGEFWGPWLRTEVGYVGVFTLMLAAIAVVTVIREQGFTRFCLVLVGVGGAIALGRYTIAHGWTYALLPPFRHLRVPARAVVLVGLGAAVLAALGLEVLLHPMPRRAVRALCALQRGFYRVAGALGLIGIPLLAHAMVVTRLAPEDVRAQGAASLGSAVFALFLLGAGIGLLALRRHRLVGRNALGALSVGLIAFDLISLGAYVEVEPNDPLGGYRHERALAFLRSDPDVFRVETAAEAQGGWAPDWALIHEMDDWSGIWNPLRLGAYDVLTWVGIQRQDPLYDFYNVKYLIARHDTPVPEHFGPVFKEGENTIYRNEHVLPRAFMVYQADVVGGDIRALQAVRRPDFDPARQVVLRKGEGAQPLDVGLDVGGGTVEIVGRGPNHIDFVVTTPVEGYMVVSEMWLPGWVAWVDGARTPVVKANYTFRAVYVSSGTHRVRMAYRPTVWYASAAISLVTFACLVVWWIWSARKGTAQSDRRRNG